MEKKGGMVAVVQGLRDSGLTVTLLDNGRRYTLMPNEHAPQPQASPERYPSVNSGSQYSERHWSTRSRENGAQATDGRYASTYKMVHCNMNPTSPQQTVTEFPPQKPDVVHGHGNFVIGGCGSGETDRPTVRATNFRGGMVWPDKGSVCASRVSMQSDAFANSLRKYPNLSPDRSSEIVQRLISFTQAKNCKLSKQRCPGSPPRNNMDCDTSKHTFVLDRNSSRTCILDKGHPDGRRSRLDSPVRERSYDLVGDCESWNRSLYGRNNDVRCFSDTKTVRQGFKNVVGPPKNHFNKPPPSRTRDQNHSELYHGRVYDQESNKSVNMETQAVVQMESKEILTLPRIVPMHRTIATPLSPIPSTIEDRAEEDLKSSLNSFTDLSRACSCKSIQVKLPRVSQPKVSSSSIDLRKNKCRSKRKTKSISEERLSRIKANKDNILSYLQAVNDKSDVHEIFSNTKPVNKSKRICQNCKHLYDDFEVLRRSVSNNTYFRDDSQFSVDKQETNKHFVEMSKHYHINRSKQVNKHKYSNSMQQHLEHEAQYLSHIDTRDRVRMSDANTEIKTNVINVSCNIQRNHEVTNLTNKSANRESHREGKIRLSASDKYYNECFDVGCNNANEILAMTHEEIRNLIDLNVLAFIEKYRINITTQSLNDLIEELFDLFVKELNNLSPHKRLTFMSEKIKNLLKNHGLSESQSMYLTNILTELWEDELLTTNNFRTNSSNYKSETIIVLSNITQNSSENKQDNSNTINEISQRDIDANVEAYINQISNEINDWLTNLRIPETQNEELRKTIINDLATDIVDRHKYLELNPSTEISEATELEHLKYQIFKLVYKLGINDMTLVDRAEELLKRVQIITVPIFYIRDRKLDIEKSSRPETEHGQPFQTLDNLETSNLGASSSRYLTDGKCCNRPTCKKNIENKGISQSIPSGNMSLKEPGRSDQGTRRMSSPAKLVSTHTGLNKVEAVQSETSEANIPVKEPQSSKNNIPFSRNNIFTGGIKIRDDEDDNKKIQNKSAIGNSRISSDYNQYLKDWVENIPLPMSTADDQMKAKNARTDIYDGILEAVSRLRSERDTFNNRFLFEDKLDDEIEKILNRLPETPELNSKKHILKVKLIEKTSDNNEFLKSSAVPYKQQLVENLKGNVPKATVSETENPDVLEIYEELQILNLVEDFIICSRYQNHDPVTAEAYRKKLMKRTENFVEELKANHRQALKNIDTKLYLQDILNALKNVPTPSNQTIQDEADEILLSIEIEKWFSELPLIQNNNYVEQLHRRRLRNNLAKQILDIERNKENTGNILDDALNREISQFLGKAPLQDDESLNINIMVHDLVKRLKNRPTAVENDSKKVAFNESGYEDFSRNIPLCSTYTGPPGKDIEAQNKSVLNTNSAPANDQSRQWHSGQYHNTSRQLFDNQNCCDPNNSIHDVPNYETFDNARPRSSSLKPEAESKWYTLQESKGYKQSDLSFKSIPNEVAMDQSNKSIQADDPNQQSRTRYCNNTEQPLLDDLRTDTNCCNDDLVDDRVQSSVRSRVSFVKGRPEQDWYTLQDSNREYSQANNIKYGNSRFSPNPSNLSRQFDSQNRYDQVGHYNLPEPNYVVPQHYLENDPNDYASQQRHDVSYDRRRSPPRRDDDMRGLMPNGIHVDDPSDRTGRHRWTNSHSASPRRQSSPRMNQRESDQFTSPHRTQFYPTSPKEPSRRISNRSPGYQTVDEDHGRSPQVNMSDLFHKSTDHAGIRRTIERNKSMNENLDGSNNFSGFQQPSVLIPPGFIPIRVGTKKSHVPDRDIDERVGGEEESEEGNDEEEEFRCQCVEKLWKSKRRQRRCPLEQCDGYPMCFPSPYFYPYFY